MLLQVHIPYHYKSDPLLNIFIQSNSSGGARSSSYVSVTSQIQAKIWGSFMNVITSQVDQENPLGLGVL